MLVRKRGATATCRNQSSAGASSLPVWETASSFPEQSPIPSSTTDEFLLPSIRPDGKRHLAENAPLCLRRQWQRPEGVERFLDVAHAWAGPVATKKRFVGDLCQARKVLEQVRRRNAANIQVNIGMAAYQEERSAHPKRPASMCEHDLQVGKIDRYIVDVDRVSVLVARARKDRCAGVEHNRDAVALRCAIQQSQLFHTLEVVVGTKKLMWGMDLDQPQTQPDYLIDVCHGVRRVPRMEAATRD